MARSGKQVRQQGHVPRTPSSIKGLSVTLFGHLLLIILHFLFIVFCYIFGDSCKYIWLLIDYL